MRDDSIPWRKAFLEHESARNIALRGVRVKEDLTLAELASKSGISEECLPGWKTGTTN